MSLASDLSQILDRSRDPIAHRVTPIPRQTIDDLVRAFGALPHSITEVVNTFGAISLFPGQASHIDYYLGVCYALKMDQVSETEFYLNVGAWIYDGAIYYRWCPKTHEFLPGIYGARGPCLAKNYDSIEQWFAASLKKAQKQYSKAEWDERFGMKGFKLSADQ